MARERKRRGMYADEKMSRQLRKGNVAEALFRLWAEEHADQLQTVEVVQQGYNPEGVVEVDDKREKLLRSSDPDFAAVRAGSVGVCLAGVSINSQKAGYATKSTMGGMCIPCPRAMSCYQGEESNLWYNRYNIANDYPQFRERMGGIDVVLVTLTLPSTDTIFKWVQAEGLETLLLEYIRGGRAGIERESEREKLLHYLKYGGRRNAKTPRKMSVLWLLHSEVESGTVPHFVTGGLSQFGRPREVCCVDIKHARDEQSLISFLSDL